MSHRNGRETRLNSELIPPLIYFIARVIMSQFTGEQLGAGKAMKLVVSRAVSRAGGG